MQLGLAEFAEYCLRTLRFLPELGLAALEFWEGWLNEQFSSRDMYIEPNVRKFFK